MHFLHGLLVEIETSEETTEEEFQTLREEAREKATTALDDYRGRVFDWYSDEGAGGWSEMYPKDGVVLGIEEPEAFKTLLQEKAKAPLEAAFDCLKNLRQTRFEWRTKEQMEADQAIHYTEAHGDTKEEEGVTYYWSYVQSDQPFIVDEALLQAIWENKKGVRSVGYNLMQAIRLALAYYDSESYFYSVPDSETRILGSTLQNALKNPHRYALVFVDLHN